MMLLHIVGKLVPDGSFFADALTLGDDGIIHLRTIFGSCLNVIADVMKNCIEGLHLLENKRSDLGRLLQLKLAFTVEQNVSLAKLANETGCSWDNKDCIPIGFAVFKCCAESIRTVLTDSNLQVAVIPDNLAMLIHYQIPKNS